MATPEVGGDGHGGHRPGIGNNQAERGTHLVVAKDDARDEPNSPRSVDDAYADHLVDHRNGGYPPPAPLKPSGRTHDEWMSRNHVDPGAAKKETFIKVDEFFDPQSGNALPSSPIEQLRKDLRRLQGDGGEQSLKVLLTMSGLSDRDFGTWHAAKDMHASAVKAQGTMESAVDRIYSVYDGILQALDATIQTARAADKNVAGGLKGKRP